ncbi:hypothetical protein LJB98_03335 [Bacteroidales bacterium OttesenSCG-928-M11]|nr:hypothetical protein [Bacteroidales bacterium OttesenSCG-928-M11]
MMKSKLILITIGLSMILISCSKEKQTMSIPEASIGEVINYLSDQGVVDNSDLMERGVRQVAKLWLPEDGTNEEFVSFCKKNYISDPKEKHEVFLRISYYLETIYGNYNEMVLGLKLHQDEPIGELYSIDEFFSGYSPSSHLSDDFYANKIAFIIALNFPEQSLKEKEALTERKDWAYARLGDIFTSRIPADVLQNAANAENEASLYIDSYNIYAGHLLDKGGNLLFDENMILLSHWNLRDEIKANYSQSEAGLSKQETIYEVMKRIISQEIPSEVINSGEYEWNPYTNLVFQDGKEVSFTPESTVRYEKLLNNFLALQKVDEYTGNTYIERNFSENMEVSVEDAISLFDNYLSAPELKDVARIVEQRLGRKLQAFDIWYDGFKPRSELDEDKLSEQTRKLYPDASAFEKDMPNLLIKLGFSPDRAKYLSDRIEVDAARGSGHAWGGQMKGEKAHLRTRIPSEGMNYKGYNIAIHEFGHNVEQTISLYDVDYYMLNGVPNTAFTEALAFVFQKRDLELLGIKDSNPDKYAMDVLDKAWVLIEISAVSMVDISVWKWLYENPNATASELRDATIRISKEVWNKYLAPIYGIEDETVLGIYSHMVSYPLYLSAYSFGQIIEFQLEQYFNGKNFTEEVDRIYKLGRLTPNAWIVEATGKPLSAEPLLKEVSKIVNAKK